MVQSSGRSRDGSITRRLPPQLMVPDNDLLRTECPARAPSSAPLGSARRPALGVVPAATVRGERARTMRTLHPKARAHCARVRITA